MFAHEIVEVLHGELVFDLRDSLPDRHAVAQAHGEPDQPRHQEADRAGEGEHQQRAGVVGEAGHPVEAAEPGVPAIDEHVDGGTSRFDKSGIIYEAVCAGCGGSDMFPTTPGAWSNTNNSTNCNEGVIKFRIQLSSVDVNVEVSNISSTGCAPFTVNFLANGVNAQGYYWDFGDGDTSTLENPSHLYTDTGTYTVMVIGYDSTTCAGLAFTDTSYATITVYDGNLNTFAGNAVSICLGDTVQLGATSTSGVSHHWTPSIGLSNDTVPNPFASPQVTTTY